MTRPRLEVAEVIRWLLSDASSWMTGEVIVIDGGGALTWPS
jgi:NAD(P)-dependent dehydrogenase (short-subunit alcohol dehydrogenase family)